MSTILEPIETIESTPIGLSISRLGREKQQSRSFQIDNITRETLPAVIQALIDQSHYHHSTLQIHLSILSGGVAGLEYTETKKIRSPEKNP